MMALTLEQKEKVEHILSDLSVLIKNGLDVRMAVSPMMTLCVSTFHTTDWYDANDIDSSSKAADVLRELLSVVKKDEINIDQLLPGYIFF